MVALRDPMKCGGDRFYIKLPKTKMVAMKRQDILAQKSEKLLELLLQSFVYRLVGTSIAEIVNL